MKRFLSVFLCLAMVFSLLAGTGINFSNTAKTAVAEDYSQYKAGNPIITSLFTADPSAHVWNDGRIYIYASHDVFPSRGCDLMDKYHVFSSDNMVTWVDEGEILSSDDVSWGRPEGGFMWAPDAAYVNGTYYFYFPHPTGSGDAWNSTWRIGVAKSSSPASGFTCADDGYVKKLDGSPYVTGIDPCIFKDTDGTYYLYTGGGANCWVARMQSDMQTLAEEPRLISNTLTDFHEGMWVFKRNNIYYAMYADNTSGQNLMRYSTASSPYGPWTYGGIVLDGTGCDTTHGSIAEYKGHWYLFYHNCEISGNGTLRSVCIDEVFFNADGSIQTVTQTTTGVSAVDYVDPSSIGSNASPDPSYFTDKTDYSVANATIGGGATRGSDVIENLHLEGAYVQWNNVNGGNGGQAMLTVYYGTPDGATALVNTSGDTSGDGYFLKFNKTSGWGDYSGVANCFVDLNPGTNNTIKLTCGMGGVNIKGMSVSLSDGTVVTPTQAPVTQPVTQAPTQPVTQAPTQPVTQVPSVGSYDLIVTDISWGNTAISAGTQVAWQVTVKNNGDTDIPAGTTIGYQVQVDNNTGVITWCDSYNSGLAAGQSVVLTTNGGTNGNKWTATNGNHTVTAWVDDVNRFPNETNENNNRTSISLTVPYVPATQAPVTQPVTQAPTQPVTQAPATQPVTQAPVTQPSVTGGYDLVITDIGWGNTAISAGTQIAWQVTVKNNGDVAIPAGTTIGYQVQVDGNTGVITWCDSYNGGLAAGESKVLTTNGGTNSNSKWTATNGNHTVMAWVDDVNRFPNEVNEGNNQYSISLTIPYVPATQAPVTQPQTQPVTQPQTQPTQAPQTQPVTQAYGPITTVHIEAEDYASVTGGVNVPSKKYEDSHYITGFAKGDSAIYNVNVADGGMCTVDIRASIKYAGTKVVNVYVDGNLAGTVDIQSTGSFATFQTFSSEPVYIGAGNHTIKLEAAGAAGYAVNWIELKGSDAAPETQPQTQNQGALTTVHIEAEDFASKTGGVSIGTKTYEDSQYITGFAKNDTATYNVSVAEGGNCTIDIRASIKYAGTKTVNVYVDGNLAGTVDIQSTGSFATFQTFSSEPVYIGAGNHTIKLEAAGAAGYAINWIELKGSDAAPETQAPVTQAPETQAPETQQGASSTIHIEAENFAAKTGGVNVPSKQYENSQYITGFAKGDTASYNVAVTEGGSYRVDVRASIKYAGTKVMNVYVDGVPAGTVDIQSTGSFATFQTFEGPVVNLTAGNHTLKLEAAGAAGYAINWIELTGTGTAPEPETQKPETQAPETQAPETQAPETQEPQTEPWTGDDNFVEFGDDEEETVAPYGNPDFVVTDISWTPANPSSGNSVVFSCTVKNQGTGIGPAGTVNGAQFQINGTCVAWSDTNTQTIYPGQSITITCNSGPNGSAGWNATSGTYTVTAWFDDVNRYTESNHNNNQYSEQITVR